MGLYAFNKTVIGQKHIDDSTKCEDYSASYSEEDDSYKIVVIADGHGDATCFRSDLGSQFVVETTLNCLKEFAKEATVEDSYICDALSDNEELEPILKQLVTAIISKWYDKVHEDIDNNPISEEELSNAGQYKDYYLNKKHLTHIYGTTLIACLWLKDYILLIQQGDGRCDVFYNDGSIDQPIPWDERCQGTFSTSMCNEDVVESIRWTVINLKEKNVIACFLGSDGVEDSFRNNEESQEGTHYFYRKLCNTFIDEEELDIDEYLSVYLREVSASGSQDDISVAGIFDREELKVYREAFQKANDRYLLEEQCELIESKLISMSRKHEALSRRVEKYKSDIAEKESLYKECEILIQNKEKEIEDLAKVIAEKEQELEAKEIEREQIVQIIDEKDENANNEIFAKLKNLSSGLFNTQIKDMMLSWFDDDRKFIKELTNKLMVAESELSKMQEEKELLSNELLSLTEQHSNAFEEFNEYNGRYNNLVEEKKRIIQEMDDLNPGYFEQ